MIAPFKRLHNAYFDVDISPEMGGAIVNVNHQGIPILRPWNGEATVRKTASYPLVPFSNRIAEGQFSFEGKSYQLLKNFGDHPHTIHGVGWERVWDYAECSETEALLSLVHKPHISEDLEAYDWPFAFKVTQRITLCDHVLRVEMCFTNCAEGNAPVGLGWHPFFPRNNGVQLTTVVDKVWLNDARMLPVSQVAVPEDWDFSKTKQVGYIGSDNCYSGWQGKAILAWPDAGRRVTLAASSNMTHLVFFTPPAPADFIAVEPVTNANDAINKDDPELHGMHILGPNESLTVFMELQVEQE